ncbi:MAG: 3-oxoacyl-[acyl-carrier-protein] reductase [Kiritimatiellia bacterium]
MGELQGQTAIVTGAARGIGRVIAEQLAAAGVANIALCDVNADWLADTASSVEALGAKAHSLAVDVSSGEAVQKAVDAVMAATGRIDILVNNAGITKDGLMMRMSESDWDAVLDVNLKGTFLFTKAASRSMMKARSGSIVNIASIIGLIGNAGQCNYAASKAGVIALTKSSAKELAGRNIRINAVAPGFITSKMTEVLPEDVKKKMLEQIPLARFGDPSDVAKAVLFLVTDASAYITGQVLSVNGGMFM